MKFVLDKGFVVSVFSIFSVGYFPPHLFRDRREGGALHWNKSGRVFVINHATCKITAFCEYTAFGGGAQLRLCGEIFVFRPTLGISINRLYAAMAVALRQ
ncbi:hypothetical protein K5D47_13535 [Pseudomonas cichorii]|nr:hypothetical protein [Pseudomonas cichorii]